MKRKVALTLVLPFALLFVVSGCGGDGDEAGDGDTVQVELSEQGGSGQSGTATLEPADGMTRVVLELSNAPAEPQPVHIHSGTCEDLGGVEYPLENLQDGTSETTVDVPLDELRGGAFAINAHESEENIQNYVACGNIPAP